MSLLPPNCFTMSKIWFHVENKISDPELKQKVHDLLGPYHEFRLDAKVRPLAPDEKGDANEVVLSDKEIVDLIRSDNPKEDFSRQNSFLCIDKCLNMYTRMRTNLTEEIQKTKRASILRFTVQYRERNSGSVWSDSLVDERPVNLKTETAEQKGQLC